MSFRVLGTDLFHDATWTQLITIIPGAPAQILPKLPLAPFDFKLASHPKAALKFSMYDKPHVGEERHIVKGNLCRLRPADVEAMQAEAFDVSADGNQNAGM